MRSLAFAALAIAAPVVCAAALAANVGTPAFARLIGPKDGRVHGRLLRTLGWLLLTLCVLAVQSGLALAFDPRYRDFPFAPLTCAAVPFLLVALLVPQSAGVRPMAEKVAALVLVFGAAAIAVNEGFANWQAVWCCAALAVVALSLARARLAQG